MIFFPPSFVVKNSKIFYNQELSIVCVPCEFSLEKTLATTASNFMAMTCERTQQIYTSPMQTDSGNVEDNAKISSNLGIFLYYNFIFLDINIEKLVTPDFICFKTC